MGLQWVFAQDPAAGAVLMLDILQRHCALGYKPVWCMLMRKHMQRPHCHEALHSRCFWENLVILLTAACFSLWLCEARKALGSPELMNVH